MKNRKWNFLNFFFSFIFIYFLHITMAIIEREEGKCDELCIDTILKFSLNKCTKKKHHFILYSISLSSWDFRYFYIFFFLFGFFLICFGETWAQNQCATSKHYVKLEIVQYYLNLKAYKHWTCSIRIFICTKHSTNNNYGTRQNI